jgi:hypothetical protein
MANITSVIQLPAEFFNTVNARPVFIPAVMITAPDGVSGAYYHRYIQSVDNAT